MRHDGIWLPSQETFLFFITFHQQSSKIINILSKPQHRTPIILSNHHLYSSQHHYNDFTASKTLPATTPAPCLFPQHLKSISTAIDTMPFIHEHRSSTEIPPKHLPCCAAYLGINQRSQRFEGSYDGPADLDGQGRNDGSNSSLRVAATVANPGAMQAIEAHANKKAQLKQTQTTKKASTTAKAEKKATKEPERKASKSNEKKKPSPPRKASKPTGRENQGPDKSTPTTTTGSRASYVKSKDTRKARKRREDATSDDTDDKPSDFSDDERKPDSKKKAPKKPTKKSNRRSSANKSPDTKVEAEHNQEAHGADASPNEQCGLCKNSRRTKPPKKARGSMVKFTSFQNAAKEAVSGFGSITLEEVWTVSKLRFCGFSDELASKLGNEIVKHGGYGIWKERPWGLGYEFVFRGDPWGSVKSRYLATLGMEWLGAVVGDGGTTREETFLRHLFRVMHNNDYAPNLVNQGMDHNVGTFFFKNSPNISKGNKEYMTISFHMPNRLRLTCASEEFTTSVRKLLEQNPKFQGERKKTVKQKEKAEKKKQKAQSQVKKGKRKARRVKIEPDANEYKIPGLSWSANYHWYRAYPEKRIKVTTGRVLRLDLMSLLEQQGWKAIHSTDKFMARGTEGEEHVPNSWYYYRINDGEKEMDPPSCDSQDGCNKTV
jgi:hypothetical protein